MTGTTPKATEKGEDKPLPQWSPVLMTGTTDPADFIAAR